jgi:hypothetical protein
MKIVDVNGPQAAESSDHVPARSKLPEPYASLRLLPHRSFPWFHNAPGLPKALVTAPPKYTLVEIGAAIGDSLTWFVKEGGAGRAYAIDTWSGPIYGLSGPVGGMVPTLYQQFLSNMIRRGIADRVTPVRMSGLEAALALDVSPDVLYVDGDHSALGVYSDIMAWYPKMPNGGIVCGDDWDWPTVQDAVNLAAKTLNKQIRNNFSHLWWLE